MSPLLDVSLAGLSDSSLSSLLTDKPSCSGTENGSNRRPLFANDWAMGKHCHIEDRLLEVAADVPHSGTECLSASSVDARALLHSTRHTTAWASVAECQAAIALG